ncbi:hypothetical protein RB195_014543 [Necator americanus]|uniref:Uncharacterized protein n=1 Tax=Necator americanus TaxID=51031 RepID=A0ABR1E0R8_NECAM
MFARLPSLSFEIEAEPTDVAGRILKDKVDTTPFYKEYLIKPFIPLEQHHLISAEHSIAACQIRGVLPLLQCDLFRHLNNQEDFRQDNISSAKEQITS